MLFLCLCVYVIGSVRNALEHFCWYTFNKMNRSIGISIHRYIHIFISVYPIHLHNRLSHEVILCSKHDAPIHCICVQCSVLMYCVVFLCMSHDSEFRHQFTNSLLIRCIEVTYCTILTVRLKCHQKKNIHDCQSLGK